LFQVFVHGQPAAHFLGRHFDGHLRAVGVGGRLFAGFLRWKFGPPVGFLVGQDGGLVARVSICTAIRCALGEFFVLDR
jgi:hypothetical protein